MVLASATAYCTRRSGGVGRVHFTDFPATRPNTRGQQQPPAEAVLVGEHQLLFSLGDGSIIFSVSTNIDEVSRIVDTA